ncbi:PfkB family carbohydrate kinase [Mycetocola sp. JXN-3]|uniref:PfkB family carbohydrate kinase n=1 Tax=Mycetocola sp. JXN-3 TaxID=2116510 RepID=UPI00165D18DD|nr:PfkB family carbohydrate kinase [Mycetocola sp. JXN-3]
MTPSPGTIIVVGSLNLDLSVQTPRLPGPGETVTGNELRFSPGGKSSNQAAAAALLGGAVSLVGAVGDDEFADRVLSSANAFGVDTTQVERIADCATGAALIAVDAEGENNIIIAPGANAQLAAAHVDAVPDALWDEASVLTLALEVSPETVLAAARRARAHDVQVVLNPSPLRELEPELLELTDLLVLNEHELAGLIGIDPEAPIAGAHALEALGALGISRCVITLGRAGALVLDATAAAGEQIMPIPAYVVDAVDTTGCGDAFTGALAHALAGGATLIEATRLGALVGAFAARGAGAQVSYPTAAALEAFGAAAHTARAA